MLFFTVVYLNYEVCGLNLPNMFAPFKRDFPMSVMMAAIVFFGVGTLIDVLIPNASALAIIRTKSKIKCLDFLFF